MHSEKSAMTSCRVRPERTACWAFLCEAHLPVANEVVQRYRLVCLRLLRGRSERVGRPSAAGQASGPRTPTCFAALRRVGLQACHGQTVRASGRPAEGAAVLVLELGKTLSPVTPKQASYTDNDFPGRLRQWQKLAKPSIPQTFEDLARSDLPSGRCDRYEPFGSRMRFHSAGPRLLWGSPK